MLRLALALAAVTACSCGALHHIDIGLERVRDMLRQYDCHDGAPAKILVDPHCVEGICGVTCAPDRWWPSVK